MARYVRCLCGPRDSKRGVSGPQERLIITFRRSMVTLYNFEWRISRQSLGCRRHHNVLDDALSLLCISALPHIVHGDFILKYSQETASIEMKQVGHYMALEVPMHCNATCSLIHDHVDWSISTSCLTDLPQPSLTSEQPCIMSWAKNAKHERMLLLTHRLVPLVVNYHITLQQALHDLASSYAAIHSWGHPHVSTECQQA